MGYMSVVEAIKVLGIERSTLYHAVNDGRLKAIKVKGSVMVPVSEVERQLEIRGTGDEDEVRPKGWLLEGRKLSEEYPDGHREMALIYDPSDTIPYGWGNYEWHHFREGMVLGTWPDGSVWKGKGGPMPEQAYVVRGRQMVRVVGNGRLRFDCINGVELCPVELAE